jgi:tetratricopeptide (TPR) repeat protein
MRTKLILWGLAGFTFISVLYGQQPATPQEAQTREQLRQQEINLSSTSQQGFGQVPTQPATPGPSQADYRCPLIEHAQKEMEMLSHAGPKVHAQRSVAMTKKEVEKEIKSAPPETVIKDVKQRGVDFDMTRGIEKKLRKANATDEVIEAVRKAGPTVRSRMANRTSSPGQAGTQEVPIEQVKAFDAIKSELDAGKTVALAEGFAKKYPNSPVLSDVYYLAAYGYQQKGNVEKAVEYTGKGLKLKPDNLPCLIARAEMLPQPEYLKNHNADRDKILKEAESDASRALQLISQLPKRPNEADADYQTRRENIASEVHKYLGIVHMERASIFPAGAQQKDELAKGELELKAAVTTTDRPDPRGYLLLGEAFAVEGKWDDAIQALTKASELGRGTTIKTSADHLVAELKEEKKAQGTAAPKP